MPIANQGEFRKSYKECDDISQKLQSMKDKYFDENGNYEAGYEFFTDFVPEANNLYLGSCDMVNKLRVMQETQEHKLNRTVDKLQNRQGEMNAVSSEISTIFSKTLGEIGIRSDVERRTLENYQIWRDTMSF